MRIFIVLFAVLSVIESLTAQTTDTTVKVLMRNQSSKVSINIPRIDEYVGFKYLTSRNNKLTIKEEVDNKMQRRTTLEIVPGEETVQIEVHGIRKKDNKQEKIATYTWNTIPFPDFEPYWIIEKGNLRDTLSAYKEYKSTIPAIKGKDSINIYVCANCINCTPEMNSNISFRVNIQYKAGTGSWQYYDRKGGTGNNPLSLKMYNLTGKMKAGHCISLEIAPVFNFEGSTLFRDIPIDKRSIIICKN